MAALPYMQLYVADYLADTMHLTTEEHGAYLLLIFNYWQTGKPIPKKRLSRIARIPNDRWTVVEDSLSEFFNDNGTEWTHKRIEADLQMVNEAQEQRAAAGKASAEARKRAKSSKIKRESNDRSATVKDSLQREPSENPTNKDTDTDTDTDNKKNKQKKSTAPKKSARASPLDFTNWPAEPSKQVWDDFKSFRESKRAKITQTVINQFGKELAELSRFGVGVDESLAICQLRGWQGIKCEWVLNHVQSGTSGAQKQFKTAAEKRADRNAEIFDYDRATNF